MNKIALKLLVVAMAAGLAGCSSGPSYVMEKGWVRSGTSYEQAKRQLFFCNEKARDAAERETQVGGLVESCMALEGFKWGVYRTRIDGDD